MVFTVEQVSLRGEVVDEVLHPGALNDEVRNPNALSMAIRLEAYDVVAGRAGVGLAGFLADHEGIFLIQAGNGMDGKTWRAAGPRDFEKRGLREEERWVVEPRAESRATSPGTGGEQD